MTDKTLNRDDERLFLYTDGELDARESQAFEQRLENEPALRARHDALHSINEGIARIASGHETPTGRAPAMRPRAAVAIAAAAMIVGAGAAIYAVSIPRAPSFTPKAHLPAAIDAASQHTRITHEFEPHIVCDTPRKFEDYTQRALGTTIGAHFDAGVTLVGWRTPAGDYTEPDDDAPSTRILLATTASGSRTITFFVPPGLDAPVLDTTAPDSDPPLVMHTAQIAGVRIYEVTPERAPSVIPILHPR